MTASANALGVPVTSGNALTAAVSATNPIACALIMWLNEVDVNGG